jgi:hypothetical protein
MNIDKLLEAIPAMTAAERKTQRENAERTLRSDKANLHEPARRILAALDAQDAELTLADEQVKEAIRAHARSLPAAERIVNAFTAIPMTETDRKLVQAVLDNPGSPSTVLTKSLGWKNLAWQLHFGAMCRAREHLLGAAPYEAKRDDKFYTGLLCDYDDATSGFTLKTEAMDAFAALGLSPQKKS